MWSKTELRWLAALTALALLLRAIRLDSGLWLDEIYSLLYSFRQPLDQILSAFPRDNHHPFYSALGSFGQMYSSIQGRMVNMTSSPEPMPRVAMKPMVCMPL